jgi:hypothetical protein
MHFQRAEKTNSFVWRLHSHGPSSEMRIASTYRSSLYWSSAWSAERFASATCSVWLSVPHLVAKFLDRALHCLHFISRLARCIAGFGTVKRMQNGAKRPAYPKLRHHAGDDQQHRKHHRDDHQKTRSCIPRCQPRNRTGGQPDEQQQHTGGSRPDQFPFETHTKASSQRRRILFFPKIGEHLALHQRAASVAHIAGEKFDAIVTDS